MEKNLNISEVEKLASFGGTFKKNRTGGRLVAFGSVRVNQDAVVYISELSDISGLLFYYCTFDDVNLEVLSVLGIRNISVLHGNFGDVELQQLKALRSLNTLKLHDTKVTQQEIDKLTEHNPCLELL